MRTSRWAQRRRIAIGTMLLAGACGCGTVPVTLPRPHGMTADRAVPVIDRCARLNALATAPETPPDERRRAWADAEGWYAVEGGRIIKLYYADVASVTRCYAQRYDVAASACVAGLMGPFSSAYVDVAMKDGTVWRMRTDPEGDPAVCLNCLPLWLVTVPRPIRKTRAIGRAFEYMRARELEMP